METGSKTSHWVEWMRKLTNYLFSHSLNGHYSEKYSIWIGKSFGMEYKWMEIVDEQNPLLMNFFRKSFHFLRFIQLVVWWKERKGKRERRESTSERLEQDLVTHILTMVINFSFWSCNERPLIIFEKLTTIRISGKKEGRREKKKKEGGKKEKKNIVNECGPSKWLKWFDSIQLATWLKLCEQSIHFLKIPISSHSENRFSSHSETRFDKLIPLNGKSESSRSYFEFNSLAGHLDRFVSDDGQSVVIEWVKWIGFPILKNEPRLQLLIVTRCFLHFYTNIFTPQK